MLNATGQAAVLSGREVVPCEQQTQTQKAQLTRSDNKPSDVGLPLQGRMHRYNSRKVIFGLGVCLGFGAGSLWCLWILPRIKALGVPEIPPSATKPGVVLGSGPQQLQYVRPAIDWQMTSMTLGFAQPNPEENRITEFVSCNISNFKKLEELKLVNFFCWQGGAEDSWTELEAVLDKHAAMLSQLSKEQKNNLKSLVMDSSEADINYFLKEFGSHRAKLFPKLKAFLDLLQALPMFPDTKDQNKRTTSQKHSTYKSLVMAATVENDVIFTPNA